MSRWAPVSTWSWSLIATFLLRFQLELLPPRCRLWRPLGDCDTLRALRCLGCHGPDMYSACPGGVTLFTTQRPRFRFSITQRPRLSLSTQVVLGLVLGLGVG